MLTVSYSCGFTVKFSGRPTVPFRTNLPSINCTYLRTYYVGTYNIGRDSATVQHYFIITTATWKVARTNHQVGRKYTGLINKIKPL